MDGFFEITARDGDARCGVLRTRHGEFETPVFMPVGTRGAVKAIHPERVRELGYGLILANTYHLFLRPGLEVIQAAGGLHRFSSWDGAILTDSGGYQVFSLSKTLKVSREGVAFRSVYDGSEVFLTPEEAVRAQALMGSDIAMVLDECVPYPCERDYVRSSVDLTRHWAERGRRAHDRDRDHHRQALFGIVQGGAWPEERRRSAELTVELDFPGYGIGGLSVGEPRELMLELLEAQVDLLPDDRPRYLMGVGDPAGIVEAVRLGVDMFDSVLPTRLARNGTAITPCGRLNLRNARYARDQAPLVDGCGCSACRSFSRAFLRHLFMAGEILPLLLLTEHNLWFIRDLVSDCREGIRAGRISELSSEWKGWNKVDDGAA
jgi:queuine tRNA-ribosyltransferase